MDQEVNNLLNKGVIVKAEQCPGELISNIFTRDKKNGHIRIILNLNKLNKRIKYMHFKMNFFEKNL